jgi:hypothetical protein
MGGGTLTLGWEVELVEIPSGGASKAASGCPGLAGAVLSDEPGVLNGGTVTLGVGAKDAAANVVGMSNAGRFGATEACVARLATVAGVGLAVAGALLRLTVACGVGLVVDRGVGLATDRGVGSAD